MSTRLLLEVQNILNRIAYKPTWKLSASAPAEVIWEAWYVTIHLYYEAPSVDDPGAIAKLAISMKVYKDELAKMLASKDFVNWIVVALIKRAELHEMDEWLKFDGAHVTDPHPELRGKS